MGILLLDLGALGWRLSLRRSHDFAAVKTIQKARKVLLRNTCDAFVWLKMAAAIVALEGHTHTTLGELFLHELIHSMLMYVA